MRVKVKNKLISSSNEDTGITDSILDLKHARKYNEVFCIKGKRTKIDYLVKCKEHGWFTITKKAFKKGSGCKECSRVAKNIKISKTLKKNHIRLNGGEEFLRKDCVECQESFLVRNTKKLKRRTTCSTKCAKKQSSERFKTQNVTEDFKKMRSKAMKEEYATGNRNPSSGFAKWLKFKNFKVQGEFELETCKALDKLSKSNKILKWEYTNDRYPYLKLGKEISSYLIDFKVYLSNDIYFYIETKGFSTLNDLYKWKRISSSHALKVFYQREHMNKIISDPNFILKSKTITQSDIDKEITSQNHVSKQFKEVMDCNLIPF